MFLYSVQARDGSSPLNSALFETCVGFEDPMHLRGLSTIRNWRSQTRWVVAGIVRGRRYQARMYHAQKRARDDTLIRVIIVREANCPFRFASPGFVERGRPMSRGQAGSED